MLVHQLRVWITVRPVKLVVAQLGNKLFAFLKVGYVITRFHTTLLQRPDLIYDKIYGIICRFHPVIGHKGPWGEQRYSSTLFLTSALEGGDGSALRPGRSLPPGKNRYPLYRRMSGPQNRSGQVLKISPPPGFGPRTVQPVGSRYTDYATRPTDMV